MSRGGVVTATTAARVNPSVFSRTMREYSRRAFAVGGHPPRTIPTVLIPITTGADTAISAICSQGRTHPVMGATVGARGDHRAGSAPWETRTTASETESRTVMGTVPASGGDLAVLPREFHVTLPGYRRTPLTPLPALAAELGVGQVWVKDESERLGLPAFKVLGASWAVNRALSARAGHAGPARSLDELRRRTAGTAPTLVTATDGNHGRALARMAQLLGVRARVHLPGGLDPAVADAVAGEGAEVVPTDLVYDDVVRHAAASVRGDDVLVQDTARPGYEDVPGWVVDGYGTLFAEVDEQLGAAPDLVVVPTGVGSLLQAALQHHRSRPPAVLAVEPVGAACVGRSLAAGRPVTVDTSVPTVLAGLNCGTVSSTAWPVIAERLDAAVAVTDDQALAAVADLRAAGVPLGPCGAAALAGLRVLAADPRATARPGAAAVVVLVGTDGGPPVSPG